MSRLSTPTENGVYRIQVIDQDLYIKSDPYPEDGDAGLKLSPSSDFSSKQKWILTIVNIETSTWTIKSADDDTLGVAYTKRPGKHWGYSYPFPVEGPVQEWSIIKDGSEKFSRIGITGSDGKTFECFSSVAHGSDQIHLYTDQENSSSGSKQCYVFELIKPSASLLDVVFVQDFTSSQAPYVNIFRKEISEIYTKILHAGNFSKGNLRFGLVAFRDHPPQDKTFVTEVYPLSNKPESLAKGLALTATGGGDGPEAQNDALGAALNANWENEAIKVVILITDSPPHGIGEGSDGFPNGHPGSPDPLEVAFKMARRVITLNVLACEPTLSGYYENARDFYTGLTRKTRGRVFDMGEPEALPTFIVGCVKELLEKEALVREHWADIHEKKDGGTNGDQIADDLYKKLTAQEVKHHVLITDVMHLENKTGEENAGIWSNAITVEEVVRPPGGSRIKKVEGNRIHDYFLAGGAQSEPGIHRRSITLAQVKNLVQECLERPAPT